MTDYEALIKQMEEAYLAAFRRQREAYDALLAEYQALKKETAHDHKHR